MEKKKKSSGSPSKKPTGKPDGVADETSTKKGEDGGKKQEEKEYILTIKDYVSDKLEKLQKNAGNFDGTMDTVIGMLKDAGSALKLPPLYDDLLKIGTETMKTANEYNEFNDKIKENSENEQEAAKNTDYISSAVGRLHMPMESLYKNFTSMQEGIAEAGIKGKNFRDVFEGIADTALALNLKPEQFAKVSDTMTDIATHGPVTSKEVDNITAAMPQAAKLMAASMHMSSEDFEKALKKGEIDGKTFVQNFSGTIKQHFAGAMQTAANSVAAKVTLMQNAFETLKQGVGNALMPIYNVLLTVIGDILNGFKTVFDWASKNKPVLNALAAVIAGVAAGMLAYNIATNAGAIASGIYSKAVEFAAGVQEGFNAVMKANPLGLVIALITGLAAGLVYCYNHCKTFRAVVLGVWETIKEFGRLASDVFKSLEHVIHSAFTLNWNEVKQGLSEGVSVISNAGSRLGGAFKKGYEDGMKDDGKATEATVVQTGVAKPDAGQGDVSTPHPLGNNPKLGGKPAGNNETSGVTGNRPIATTINIKINDLVKELNLHTTNIQSGARQIKDIITEVLLSAVNDSQRIAHD